MKEFFQNNKDQVQRIHMLYTETKVVKPRGRSSVREVDLKNSVPNFCIEIGRHSRVEWKQELLGKNHSTFLDWRSCHGGRVEWKRALQGKTTQPFSLGGLAAAVELSGNG